MAFLMVFRRWDFINSGLVLNVKPTLTVGSCCISLVVVVVVIPIKRVKLNGRVPRKIVLVVSAVRYTFTMYF